MNKKVLYIPLCLFLLLASALLWQLARNAQGEDPTLLESSLVGKELPNFTLQALDNPETYYQRSMLLTGKPFLLNVWATWCPTCQAEHQYLRQLASQGVTIVGLNYKDDRQKAQRWLEQRGTPYRVSLFDGNGMYGLDLGVYGAPETFLVDGQGRIRYRLVGELNQKAWKSALETLWNQFASEAEQ
ncbi:MAG: Thiol:disulfide interchange protein DsbE [Candidatus Erwinia impunctatus]|nr:Thiol:disulfide interchange protein DsbE [Culicoides impunctatus]